MNYYAFHIGDYAVATGHLEPMEDLAYRRLLDLYYVREAPLPDDAVAVAKLIRLRGEAEIVQAMLTEFFELTPAGWVHDRCDAEIEQAQSKRTKAKASAAKRWHSGGNADAQPPHDDGNAPKTTPTPTPTPKTTPTEAEASVAAGKPARATRKCPAAFAVTDQLKEWARDKAPDVDLEAETEKLRDHTFKNATVDWPGAWRNWMRNAQEWLDAGPRRTSGGPPNKQLAVEARNDAAADAWLSQSVNAQDYVDAPE